jgi:3-oxoacyl-[acyl-carrier protein] reductase
VRKQALDTRDSRVAIVRGGAGELGVAIAARLRADGFRVAVADITIGAAATGGTPGTADDSALAVRVDVTDPDSAVAMCAAVRDRWGRVDVLVNNAGIAGPTAPVADYPPDAWWRVIAVNLTGVFGSHGTA